MCVLLLLGGASAQDSKGWLGADTLDVTKAEADKLGWDAPHGAKLGVVASGSPAEKAGLKSGDVVLSVDGVEAETSTDLERPSRRNQSALSCACACYLPVTSIALP